MDELIAFLRVRLDEDEQIAKDAAGLGTAGHWRREAISCVVDVNGRLIVYGEGTPTPEAADHIARHDPARVLADVAAKRAVIAELTDGYAAQRGDDEAAFWHKQGHDYARFKVLRLLAEPYADHSDFRESWRA